MVKLEYVGKHQPQGMIVEVDEKKAKLIAKLKEWKVCHSQTK